MSAKAGKPRFFETPDEFRLWLAQHHATATELLVGFHKRSSGRASMSWTESVREALCFGWIDGVRHSLGEGSYAIRFTPRRPGSVWSARNLRHVEELIRDGRMTPAGLGAYHARRRDRTGVYSFEQPKPPRLDRLQEQHFRAHRKAWKFFKAQPPSYRRTAIHWVVSAKRQTTRAGRLDELIAESAAGRRLARLLPPTKRS
jgi:uncharacterized protein YdeI (YjbR/CyaY-like superfamily)